MFRTKYKGDFEMIVPNRDSLIQLSKKMKVESKKRDKNHRFVFIRYGALAVSMAVVISAIVFYPHFNLSSNLVASKLSSQSKGVGKIDAKQSNQPKVTNGIAGGVMIGAGGGNTTPAPNVTDPNLLAAGVKEADIVKTDSNYSYALVKNQDGTIDVVIVAAIGLKSTVTADVKCDDALKKDASFSTTTGTSSRNIINGPIILSKSCQYISDAMYIENNRLVVIIGYKNSTDTLVYDISNPVNPTLLNNFGQSGLYNTSRFADGILYTATTYTVYTDSEKYLATYAPKTYVDGVAKFIPMSDIYSGTEKANQYMVVTSIQMTDTPKTLYTKAILGNYGTVYASADSLLLACPVQQTVDNYTTYSDWYQVPKDLITSSTGSKVRYAWKTTSTTTNQTLTLFSLNGGNMVLKATGAIPGGFIADESMIDENGGYFRLVTDSEKEASIGGSFENEKGDSIDYCSPTGIPSTPDAATPNQATNNMLYVLDGNLKQVGGIANLTSESISSIQFNGDICTITTENQTISVDLSNPAEPKVLQK